MSVEKIIIWLDSSFDPEKWRVDVLRRNFEGAYEPFFSSDCADFPVNVDEYGPFEEDLLIQSLKKRFPDADISFKF
jgi:hypothetical protein